MIIGAVSVSGAASAQQDEELAIRWQRFGNNLGLSKVIFTARL
jgi:hypothetical protein